PTAACRHTILCWFVDRAILLTRFKNVTLCAIDHQAEPCSCTLLLGSNLLKERLQLMNPSATFHCIGRLKDYKLNFGFHGEEISNNWHGGAATVEESIGNEVWGVIWKICQDDLARLDEQEGVDVGIYRPLQVKVDTDEGEVVCRTYQMNNFKANLPSPPYMQVRENG
ncbi:hypothetical protein SKAU_G00402330, partial [Synaphobranchus kaupii]